MDRRHVEPSELQVGDYVDYKPAIGSYTAEAKYSGYTSNLKFTTQTELTALKWRVWKTDSNNLYLISDVPTTGKLMLSGALGYNNGVTLLDNICSNCYKNSLYSGITVRNIKLEDITEIMITKNGFENSYGTTPYTYTFAAPYIWTQYEKNISDSQNNRSTPYSLTTRTTSNLTSISPFFRTWGLSAPIEYSNAKYDELLLIKDETTDLSYYLSSRYVQPHSNDRCYFGLQFIFPQGIFAGIDKRPLYGLDRGETNSFSNSERIRPLVIIPLTSCKLKVSNTNGMDFDIMPR